MTLNIKNPYPESRHGASGLSGDMKLIEPMFILGTPKAQPRVKATMRGVRAGVYTPKTAEAWKTEIKNALTSYHGARFEGALSLSLQFYLPRPKSHFAVKKGVQTEAVKPAYAYLLHTKKPDLDNLIKAVKDAMSDCGIWGDDAQVIHYSNPMKSYMQYQTGMSLSLNEYKI